MNITRAKIHLACARDDSRPTLSGVYYNPEAHRLEACDGFVLAVCPVQDEARFDKGRVLPVSAIKRAQQLASSQTPPAVALDDEEGVHTDGESFPYVAWELADGQREIIERFPDVEVITPKEKDVDFLCALDAKKLYELARAICEDGSRSPATMVCLYQNPSSTANAILVRPHRANADTNMDNYGLIMPVAAREEYRRTMPHPREVLDTLIDLFRLELQSSHGVRVTVWRGSEFLASGQADRLEEAAVEAARKVLDVLRAGATEMPFADAVAAEHVLKRVLRVT